ncbi:TPA: restriction endonuclease subunit S [Streptococcus suis]
MPNKDRNIPKRRFKAFENADAWELRKLGELGTVAMCRRIFKEQTSEIGEIPFYKIGTFGGTPDAFISKELFEEYRNKYSYPTKGDILISASGSIGRTVEFLGKDEYFQDSNIVWLKHDGKIDNIFLKQFYSIVKWSGVEGSTIKRLYNENILNTEIVLPTLPEQKAIGTFFSTLDRQITLHQRKLDKLKHVKQAYLSEMFPAEGERVPKRRFPGFADDWELRKLGEVADIIGGGTPSTSNSEFWDGDIDWYTPAEIGEQIYVDGSERKITQLGLDKSSATLLPADKTILFTSRAGIGKTAILRSDATTNQGFQSIVVDNNTEPYFIFSMTDKIKNKAISVASGSTFAEISSRALGQLEFMFPSINEQKAIGTFFSTLDQQITLHQRKLEKLKNLKKALLNELFV